jgi:hypothetical protein
MEGRKSERREGRGKEEVTKEIKDSIYLIKFSLLSVFILLRLFYQYVIYDIG